MDQNEFSLFLQNWIPKHRDEIVSTLLDLIAIPSTEQPARDQEPFGPEVARAFKLYLENAAGFEMSTKNVDGYAVHAEVGTGAEMAMTLTHADIVPIGTGWARNPYGEAVSYTHLDVYKRQPHGCIKEAQDLAANLFGADLTYFVVNGTSGAIQSMVLAALNDGDSIIIPRNIHKSILSAIILAGARPVFVLPAYDDYLGFALGVEETALAQCLSSNPEAQKAKAVLLVNPTYYGTSQDLSSISSLVHSHNKVLPVSYTHLDVYKRQRQR